MGVNCVGGGGEGALGASRALCDSKLCREISGVGIFTIFELVPVCVGKNTCACFPALWSLCQF